MTPASTPILPASSLTQSLAAWLEGGGRLVGEVVIRGHVTGWELRHVDDAASDETALGYYDCAEAARELAKYDSSGQYRPLKAAPTLIRGWRLVVPDVATVRMALDFFYPAALGNWVAFTSGRATPVPLKVTFARQTGMYRITGMLDDAGCRTVVAATCDYATQCRRRITWPVADGVPLGPLPAEKTNAAPGRGELPILCLEACNLLVAAARTHIKKERAAAGA